MLFVVSIYLSSWQKSLQLFACFTTWLYQFLNLDETHSLYILNSKKAKLRVSLSSAVTLIMLHNTAWVNRKYLPPAFWLLFCMRCVEDLKALCCLSDADMTFLESEKTVYATKICFLSYRTPKPPSRTRPARIVFLISFLNFWLIGTSLKYEVFFFKVGLCLLIF